VRNGDLVTVIGIEVGRGDGPVGALPRHGKPIDPPVRVVPCGAPDVVEANRRLRIAAAWGRRAVRVVRHELRATVARHVPHRKPLVRRKPIGLVRPGHLHRAVCARLVDDPVSVPIPDQEVPPTVAVKIAGHGVRGTPHRIRPLVIGGVGESPDPFKRGALSLQHAPFRSGRVGLPVSHDLPAPILVKIRERSAVERRAVERRGHRRRIGVHETFGQKIGGILFQQNGGPIDLEQELLLTVPVGVPHIFRKQACEQRVGRGKLRRRPLKRLHSVRNAAPAGRKLIEDQLGKTIVIEVWGCRKQ